MTISSKDTNLPFSEEELAVFSDTQLIDTKLRIMGKAESKLADVYSLLQKRSVDWDLETEYLKSPGKISKGENHRGYPYLVLDYPRNLSAQSGISMRTLIWWGHHIMITLHVHGACYDRFLRHLFRSQEILAESGFMALSSGDQWSNDPEDYHSLGAMNMSFEEYLKNEIESRGLFRLAQFRKLTELNDLSSITEKATDILFKET